MPGLVLYTGYIMISKFKAEINSSSATSTCSMVVVFVIITHYQEHLINKLHICITVVREKLVVGNIHEKKFRGKKFCLSRLQTIINYSISL